jgi:hypothetical protein
MTVLAIDTSTAVVQTGFCTRFNRNTVVTKARIVLPTIQIKPLLLLLLLAITIVIPAITTVVTTGIADWFDVPIVAILLTRCCSCTSTISC